MLLTFNIFYLILYSILTVVSGILAIYLTMTMIGIDNKVLDFFIIFRKLRLDNLIDIIFELLRYPIISLGNFITFLFSLFKGEASEGIWKILTLPFLLFDLLIFIFTRSWVASILFWLSHLLIPAHPRPRQ